MSVPSTPPEPVVAPYRRPAEKPVLPPTVEVGRGRLRELERCEELLLKLEESIFCVDHSSRSRGRNAWSVGLYTGEASFELYPCISEGEGPTLQTAVEDALGWEPIEPEVEEAPEPKKARLLAAVVWIGAAFGWVFWFLSWIS